MSNAGHTGCAFQMDYALILSRHKNNAREWPVLHQPACVIGSLCLHASLILDQPPFPFLLHPLSVNIFKRLETYQVFPCHVTLVTSKPAFTPFVPTAQRRFGPSNHRANSGSLQLVQTRN
eukprot:1149865-Pelagomonas_calceolata.AAC.8